MTRAFRIPAFPLECNVFRGAGDGPFPPAAPPDISRLPCQLRHPLTASTLLAFQDEATVSVLCVARRTDLRAGTVDAPPADAVECPAGTGRFYIVLSVEDVARGFDNEYRRATILAQTTIPGGWPTPLP